MQNADRGDVLTVFPSCVRPLLLCVPASLREKNSFSSVAIHWLYGSIDVHSDEGGTESSCERMSPAWFMKWYLSVGRL